MAVRETSSSLSVDALADVVTIKPGARPPASRRAQHRPRLGPTAFDKHMWATCTTGEYASLKVPVERIQDVRVRLARSQRWLSYQHEAELKKLLPAPPYIYKTSLIITTLDGVKLAQGPVKGNLTSPELSRIPSGQKVVVWFRMHTPLDRGRRARPESYVHMKKGDLPCGHPRVSGRMGY